MFSPKLISALALVIPTMAVAQTRTAPTYVKMAGASDAYEMTSSRLVLQSTQNPKVRRFANMMIRDHTKSTNDVKAAARVGHVPAPAPRMNAEQTQMVADLRRARGPERDRVYVRQQKMAHQKALALHSGYARRGDKYSLKRVAGATAPVVQHHIEMLGDM